MYKSFQVFLLSAAALLPVFTAAQQPKEDFTLFNDRVVALTHVELIDGTGAPSRADQSLVIRDGRIEAIGPSATLAVPADAKVRDLTGHTVLPGFVMMHEHMFYPAGIGNYTEMLRTFPRLYLAGGATTIRTAGSTSPFGDINLRNEIAKGTIPGPDVNVTGPFIEGPGLLFLKVKITKDPTDARALIDYWAREGATSYKVYMNIPRATLSAVVEEAHRRKHKVTGHLCSITYREAADLGIDNLEHGFLASTDFVKDKVADACPKQADVLNSLAALDPDGPQAKALIDHLIAKKVALTSTLTIFETFAAGRPMAPAGALELLTTDLREQYLSRWSTIAQTGKNQWTDLLRIGMRLEKKFVEAGGYLMAGTDPTGYGGVVAGFSNVRELELLVEAGFTLPEAVRISTRNGAEFLGRASDVGTLENGKRADLIVFKGSAGADIKTLRDLQWTMKSGVAYDRARILAAMKGKIGLY
ncbi:MAG: amidohydrolase family protein [Betaproteobacteria bacterium]